MYTFFSFVKRSIATVRVRQGKTAVGAARHHLPPTKDRQGWEVATISGWGQKAYTWHIAHPTTTVGNVVKWTECMQMPFWQRTSKLQSVFCCHFKVAKSMTNCTISNGAFAIIFVPSTAEFFASHVVLSFCFCLFSPWSLFSRFFYPEYIIPNSVSDDIQRIQLTRSS